MEVCQPVHCGIEQQRAEPRAARAWVHPLGAKVTDAHFVAHGRNQAHGFAALQSGWFASRARAVVMWQFSQPAWARASDSTP